jgi:hypothetical protein
MGKEQTYADEAKAIMNKYKLRLGEKFDKGDKLALEAMNQELSALQKKQEMSRIESLPDDELIKEFACGGRLRKYAGPGEYPNRLATPEYMAQGQRSFMDQGPLGSSFGLVPNGGIGVGDDPMGLQKYNLNLGSPYLQEFDFNPLTSPNTIGGGRRNPAPVRMANPGDGLSPLLSSGMPTLAPDINTSELADVEGMQTRSAEQVDNPFKSRVPWFGAASNLVGNLLMNRQLDLPELNLGEYKPDKVVANLVDYSRGREQTMREKDVANQIIARNARGAGSQNALMENILAGTAGTQRTAGQQFNASIENEGNINAQIKNDTQRVNAQLGMNAEQMNSRNRLLEHQFNTEMGLINEQRRDAKIGGIMDSVTGYGRDLMEANKYDQMLNMMMADKDYKVNATKDNLFRKIFQISPDQGITFKNPNVNI